MISLQSNQDLLCSLIYELGHIISYKIACAPNPDSDQTMHLHVLSRTTIICLKNALTFGYQKSEKQCEISLCICIAWQTCSLVGYAMSQLIFHSMHWFSKWTMVDLIRLSKLACIAGPSLPIYSIRTLFLCWTELSEIALLYGLKKKPLK